MGKHSVADAKNNLSKLIDRALEGESVVITRIHPVRQMDQRCSRTRGGREFRRGTRGTDPSSAQPSSFLMH